MKKRIDSKGQWTVVIHRVSQTTAEVFVGTLFPNLKKPNSAKVCLLSSKGKTLQTEEIRKSDWERPFRKIKQRFYKVCKFEGLEPDTNYEIEFYGDIEKKPSWWQRIFYRMPDDERGLQLLQTMAPEGLLGEQPDDRRGLQLLQTGKFKTLPAKLSGDLSDSFTVAIGSCFYEHLDGGMASYSYKMLYEKGNPQDQPDVKFLTGDQVYLDIGFDSVSPFPSQIRDRIADDYALHWRALSGMMRRGGTWMLPDDHEYWNDYPFYDTPIPLLWSLKLPWIRRAWRTAAKDGVGNVQRTLPVETFSIGKDLSFLFADLRSYRCGDNMTGRKEFASIIEWATSLKCPGILVLPQPLIVEKNNVEKNLRGFSKDYQDLICALGQSGHDVVVLSGDVHFGRVACVELGNKGTRLIEVISSPLSNLSLINAIATNTPSKTPRVFPPEEVSIPAAWKRQTVYYKNVVTVDKKISPRYLLRHRTREHFMTVAFHKPNSERVAMAVKAWRVREHVGIEDLPREDFQKPFLFDLK